MITEEDLSYDFAILIPGNTFHKDFLTSLMDTLIWLMQNNYTFIYRVWHSPLLPDLRNALIGAEDIKSTKINNIPFDGKYNVKKIILIDSDMCWEVEDFASIALSDKDVVTGIVSIGEGKYNISKRVVGQEPWGYYIPYMHHEINKKDLFKIDACGTAFMAIKTDVFKKIKFPWFEFKQVVSTDNYHPRLIGEDYTFSEKIYLSGYSIYADPRCKPGHLKMEPKY